VGEVNNMEHNQDTQFFVKHGYQVFKNVLDKNLLFNIKSYLTEEMNASLAEIQDDNDVENNDAKDHLCAGHFPLKVRLSTFLWEIPKQNNFQKVISALLNSSKLYMHMPPTARFVLPENVDASVPPHQDISYNKHLTDFVVIWVPLVDIDMNCGGVGIFENGHIKQELLKDQESEGFWLKGIDLHDNQIIHCKMEVGDVLALDKWVVHKSMPNHSRTPRLSIDYRFFGESSSSEKHYLDLQNMTIVAPKENTK
jgi:ectoine hydroxylase-related dioxygenase (phytanoyl-CoA dioxygenase family)